MKPVRGLVVDGTPVRDLTCASLQRAGLDVVGVDAADEAEAAIAAARPDWLILDADTCSTRDYAALSRGGAIPALVLRADPAETWPENAGLPVIRKPFSPPAFVMAVRIWLLECGLIQPLRRPMPRAVQTLILDLCAGSGLSTCTAADEGVAGTVVVGLDSSEEQVRRAREDTAALGYEDLLWAVADARWLPFRSGVFDEVIGCEYVVHGGAQAINEAERVGSARGTTD